MRIIHIILSILIFCKYSESLNVIEETQKSYHHELDDWEGETMKNDETMSLDTILRKKVLLPSQHSMPMGHLAALKREDPLFEQSRMYLDYLDHPFDRRVEEISNNLRTASPTASLSPSSSPTISPSAFPTKQLTEPLRIVYETSEIEKKATNSTKNERKLNTITQKILPRVSEIWSSILKVVPVERNIDVDIGACYGFFDIPEEVVQHGVSDVDLLVFVSGHDTMNDVSLCRENVLASASYCTLDQFDRPIVGFVNFCLDNINTKNEDAIVAVGVHELAHMLGFSDDLFQYFRDGDTGDPLTPRPLEKSTVKCVNGSTRQKVVASNKVLQRNTNSDSVHYEIVTPTVLDVARNHFNCPNLNGARLENQPTKNSCTGAHWDERFFFTDAMSPIFSSDSVSILSPLTVALLKDTGWYDVSFSSSYIRNTPFGLGAGCEFLEEDNCIIEDKVPEEFEPFFCDTVTQFNDNGKIRKGSQTTCDPSYSHIASCDLVDFSTTLPSGSQSMNIEGQSSHFSNPNLGSLLSQTDNCPIPSLFHLDCTDSSTALMNKQYPEEQYGADSRCFNSFFDHPVHGDIPRGVCLKSHCNRQDHTLEVTLGQNRIICKYDGEEHRFPQSDDVSFVCPKLSSICPQLFCPAMCSGQGVCNYERDVPSCDCYDINDVSPGCFGVGYQSEFYNNDRPRGDTQNPNSGVKLISRYTFMISLLGFSFVTIM